MGDHGQLPPVMSSGSVVQDPNLRLEKIHRQALDNPIIKLSRRVRETGKLFLKKSETGGPITFDLKKNADIVLGTARVDPLAAPARSAG